ncbi:MAG: flagellar basal body-associated FliL family protein [Bdellovibrionales bacterium]|nr:flagellar basal body-associated FliL family protein [Bdellovibrionales bacterium]
MADEEKNEEQQGEATETPAAGTSKKKMFLIVGAIVGLVILIGAPTAYFLLNKEKPEVEDVDPDSAQTDNHEGLIEGSLDEDEYDESEKPLGAFFPLETFIVNLRGGRYLRTQVQLEFVDRDIPSKFYGQLIPLRDAMITLFASKSQKDIASEKGREQLKAEIKDLANELMKREEINQVYFTQFVVQ